MSRETQPEIVAESNHILDQLEAFASGGRNIADLTVADQDWLVGASRLVGLQSTEAGCLLVEGGEKIDLGNFQSLQKATNGRALLSKLYYTLRAMQAAGQAGSQKWQADSPSSTVVIHNRLVAENMKLEYDSASFENLLSVCKSNHVFALKVNEQSGLVTTAEAEENWDMSGRQWVTDTVRCGDIERDTNPLAWTRALLTLCDFYNQEEEVEAIERSIQDPDYYRKGGLLNGVAHIFIPHTLKRDTTWFNNKRLESHGLALKALCDTVLAGTVQSKAWGFSKSQLQGQKDHLTNTIVLLASYLKSINTDENGRFDFAAPSAGPWEEIPFPGGQTWDTEAIRSAFESLRQLMFDTHDNGNSQLQEIKQLITGHKHAQWLRQRDTIDHLIKQARGKIIDRLFGEVEPVENPSRPMDCSLAFITTSTITFADDTVSDVLMQYQLLQALEKKLVRTHGIIRYAPFSLTMEDGSKEPVFDSYLADNYWLLPAVRSALSASSRQDDAVDLRHFGSSDCSTHDDYLARVKMARPGTEAQWCFVSVMAEGYCRQVLKLHNLQKQNPHPDLHNLIALGLSKATEYLNRSFARITGPNAIKANGHDCPAWSIPEAYEMVSPLGADSSSHLAALPGVNTPLAWGQASLYRAAALFSEIIK